VANLQAPQAAPTAIWTPLAETKRGYGIHIDVTNKDKKIIYTNGAHVIVRSLEDPSKGDLFSEHKGCKVNVAKFSPNGEWVASGDDKGNVLVWGVKSKIIKNRVLACRNVLDISWSSDGTRIVAVGDGSEARAKVFPWDGSNAIGDIMGHSKPILSCAFRPARPFRIACCAEDNLVSFHSGPPFAFTSSFNEHQRYPNCVRYNPSGSHFVSVGADSKVFLFDGQTGVKVKEFESKEGHKGSIYACAFNADGKQLLTVSADKTAKIWDVEAGACTKTFTFGNAVEDFQVGCAWLGDYLLTISLSGAINYLDPENPGKPKRIVHGHQGLVLGLEVDEKNNVVYSSDSVGMLARWPVDTGLATWFSGKGHGGKSILSPAVSCDSANVYSVGFDDKLRMNSVAAMAFNDNALALGGMPTGIAACNHEPNVAFVSLGQQKIVIVKNGNVGQTVPLKYKPTCIAISPDDKELAVGGDDKKLHIFARTDGTGLKETHTLGDHAHDIEAVAFSPDGKWVASSDLGRAIYVRDRANNYATKNPLGWKYHNSKVVTLAWSPNSKVIASGSQDGSVIIWRDTEQFETNNRTQIDAVHVEGVTRIRFLSDDTFVTTGNDRAIKIFKV